jgi:cob(I)alamin adenosyltransferase
VKIYTRTGDDGETALRGGGRVPKDDARVAAIGAVDEANAAVGFAHALEPAAFEAALLETIQRDLFAIGAELATPDPGKQATAAAHAPIAAGAVTALERAIDRCEQRLAPLSQFILPGGTPKAAALHLARTVCRRAERDVVRLGHQAPLSPVILRYLNRLSDLLFVLARAANHAAGMPDLPW